MRITNDVVKLFENDQKSYGTETAISNVLWRVASDQMRDIGVRKLTTVYTKDARGKPVKQEMTSDVYVQALNETRVTKAVKTKRTRTSKPKSKKMKAC